MSVGAGGTERERVSGCEGMYEREKERGDVGEGGDERGDKRGGQ